MAHVYLVTNKLNGKQYVGQTIVESNKVGHGYMITAAYKKYGKDNFTYERICDFLNNRPILNYVERFWIRVMDTRKPNGYNIEEGGSTKGEVSAETKQKLRLAKLGTKHTKKSRAKISMSNLKNMTEERRKKLSDARKKWVLTEESKAKMSRSALGKPKSEETKRKIALALSHRKLSAETRQKLSEAAKQQWARQKGVL
jgi:methyltransferase-like protein